MIEGISNLIIKQYIREKNKLSEGIKTTDEDKALKGVINTDIDTGFSLSDLNIEGLDQKQADHISYLVKKLLNENTQLGQDKKSANQRKKVLSLEIEKQMNRYVTDKEKELIGILINKLI